MNACVGWRADPPCPVYDDMHGCCLPDDMHNGRAHECACGERANTAAVAPLTPAERRRRRAA